MDQKRLLQQIRQHYPALEAIPPDRLAEAIAAATLLSVDAGAVLFRELEDCAGFPFVLDGQIWVTRGAPDGRSLELYRVLPGEVCLVSTGCLIGSKRMTAQGVAVGTVTLLMVGRDTLVSWLAYEPVRLFLLELMAERMVEMAALVEAVAFQRLDQRLAAILLGRGRFGFATHQSLADELGTAREIVSRLLKRFEQQSWLALGRERIEITDAIALRMVADGQPPAGR
ncbi:MAG: Crp/Fnr family transcriptional regulator [Burkholderiaceae bacterium]|nr:Crp/Fnr family transcriptional regulator [Burkholderiaceae bacterium]